MPEWLDVLVHVSVPEWLAMLMRARMARYVNAQMLPEWLNVSSVPEWPGS